MSSTHYKSITKREIHFVEIVWKHYARHGRHNLPWRKTQNPYHILVSEIMLQQTQVDRVLPKYLAFLKLFPSASALSKATLGDVLRAWQGLGYNRRAKMLHASVKYIVTKYANDFPKTRECLVQLPGVGEYTAGAILAFAFNIPVPIIETNIRSAIIHYFFKKKDAVSDRECIQYIERTLDNKKPREWYYALMDYGAYIKKEFGNPNHRGAKYSVQSPFQGSDRQIRGAILKVLSIQGQTREYIHNTLPFETNRIDMQLLKLTKECLVDRHYSTYCLPQ